jgi:HPt (histidine-containing phosphotransfer) domain-containing protein
VHSVRGALAVFGHPQLAALCAQLEQTLRDSTRDITQGLRELTDALARLLEQ